MPKHDLFARSTGLLRIEARGEPPPAEKPDSASAGLHEETCPPNNVIAFDNAIEVIETGGLRIAVWGDNRPVPDPSLDPYLENIDVLILPVETILTRAEADAIVRKYDPKAVIPAHLFCQGFDDRRLRSGAGR